MLLAQSTVILDQYSNSPSYRVGLQINEDIVSASSQNPDLFDNAQGFSNESAPGADRFKISVTLTKKSINDTDDLSFIELLRVENGEVRKMVQKTDYNIFKDELARRTYDESGDYYVRPFSIDIRETLNDRLANNGIYFESQTTQNGNIPSDSLYTLQISPGKAYVRGYEIDKISTSSIDVAKPRTTRSKENISVPIRIGNVIKIENLYGVPNINLGQVDNRINFRIKEHATGWANGETIGVARVYDIEQVSSSGVSTTRYDLRTFDIDLYTELTVGLGVTAVDTAHVKGKYSGASGLCVNALSNVTTIVLF